MHQFEPKQIWMCRDGRTVEILEASTFLTVRDCVTGQVGNRYRDGTLDMIWRPVGGDLLWFLYQKSNQAIESSYVRKGI